MGSLVMRVGMSFSGKCRVSFSELQDSTVVSSRSKISQLVFLVSRSAHTLTASPPPPPTTTAADLHDRQVSEHFARSSHSTDVYEHIETGSGMIVIMP